MPSRGAKTPSNTEATRCEDGGEEILPESPIRVRQGSPVTFTLYICKSAADVRVDVDGTKVTEKLNANDIVTVTLPRIAPGIHTLFWACRFSSEDWQTRAEVAVDDTPMLRLRKSGKDSSWPANRGSATLEVVP